MLNGIVFLVFTTMFSQCLAQSLNEPPLTFNGLGKISIGMSIESIENLGYRLSELPVGSDECVEVTLNGDDSIWIMLEDRQVTRVSTRNPSIKTKQGIKVGTTEKQVKRVYGANLLIESHQHDEQGHYLITKSKNGKFAIVFETDGIHVTDIHAGLKNSAQYVEGCL